MKQDKSNNGYDNFSFVFKTNENLNNLNNRKNYYNVTNRRNKWVATAIIALAAGSTVMLSNPAQAATNDDASSNVEVKVVNKEAKSQINEQNQQTASLNDSQAEKTSESKDDGNTAGQTEAVQAPANQADHVKGNVQAAWDQGYKGQGTVVAVIDSGADPSHKDFQTMPSDPKLSKDDVQKKIDQQGYGKYVNEKFPYVYNYADKDNDYITADDNNPNDSPHGQHVSGIIAAYGHPHGKDEYVVGVAPEAQLMQLRVFGQFSDEKTDDVARAIYDATNMGADVIQMSLGQGVADQQLTNVEQKAVQYAIDHGVFVSISASNNGNSASVDNPSKVSDENYGSGSNAGNYQPLNSGTVANPGASKNALTVAAETSGLGKNSDMASFSSWGPLSDFSLKPDLSAPGYQVVSTVNHDKYETMSGTSMAGPFAAASAALVVQRLKKTNPELKGAELVQAVKALLMNSAKPQTQNGYSTPVSPRRQGAGQIDVGAATASPVYVTAEDGTSSLSLGQVDGTKTFSLTFHNLTDQTQEYSFDDLGGGYTEQRDEESGVFHDVQLAGAHVTGDTSLTLSPKESKTVQYTLNLQGLNKNQLVEGWLNFTNKKDNSTLVVPYLAYYGDLTSENVFDQDANQGSADVQGNQLVNEDNYPRGVADEESLKELVNVDGDYNWQEVAKLYESGKVAFSPNNDKKSDLLKPVTYLKQNVKDLQAQILDANGNLVRVVADVKGVDKSYDENGVTKDTSLSVSMRNNPDVLEWDGTFYNAKTGQNEKVPDGKYTYRLVATLWNDGENQVQTHDFTVIVDTQAPTVSNLSYNKETNTLTGTYEDSGSGFTDYSYATVKVNDKVLGFKLNNGDSGFDNADKTKGHFSFNLGDDVKNALASSTNKITLALSDVADNTALATLDVQADNQNNPVAVWNASDGQTLDKNSSDYDQTSGYYTLRGSASADFYLNGGLVQVQNGEYEVPVKADATQLVFSKDADQKQVLKTLNLYTPQAFFNWQKVDGFDGNFGVKIYSVQTNNADDAVVQAAVPKGNNVKAYAKDYFTGELYTGEVKDGVATFHVHTSINPDSKTGKNMRALLTGWTEVDGPSYNDKQVTSQAGVSSTNHIGVYYVENSAARNVYTNRDDLDTNVSDQVADQAAFGPSALPGHALSDLTTRTDPNPDIHFDYVNDNDTTRFGTDAIAKGYYDPNTKKFTVTGHVDSNVKSLTVLADNSNEDAAQNQVQLGKNGEFKFTFTINQTAQRPVAYIYKDNDGKSHRGTLNVVLDTTAPVLNVDQANGSQLELWTNQANFKLSGNVTDNLDGYRLFVNGNNVYTEFLNSGYNTIAGFNDENGENHPNPYGQHTFEQNLNLNDNNNQPTTHTFTVYVVDQVGNKVEKQIVVHYDPNYNPTPTSEAEPTSSPTSQSTPLSEEAGSQTKPLVAKSFKLLHNAYVYDQNGKAILTTDKAAKRLLKKGKHISALDNGKVYVFNNVKYYKIGEDQYVKVLNTVLQPAKRLKLKHNAYVYDAKGRVVKNAKGHKLLLKKHHWISALNNGETFLIKGKLYYKLALDNKFVKVANTQLQKAKKLKLTHSAWLYDANGKRVKHSKTLKKGTTILATNNADKFVIKGKSYYKLPNGHFVKVVNTQKKK